MSALDETVLANLYDWLVRGAGGTRNPADVVQRFADDLVRAGIPLERAAAFVRTLHPHIMGRRFIWEPGKKVAIGEASYEMLNSEMFKRSPVHAVSSTGKNVRVRLTDTTEASAYSVAPDLAREGFTDYFIGALPFLSGQVHAVTFATKHPDGFSDAQIHAIERLLAPLARIGEILALHRTAVNLLNTYVGRNAGERILNGHIQRGHADAIRAFIWFSDLRGFTELTARVEPGVVIGVLNELFECQVPAIEKHGGEVLKFMGDGLLAIFPIDAPPPSMPSSLLPSGALAGRRPVVPAAETPPELVENAFLAAEDAFVSLDKLNAGRAERGDPIVRFGLALHLGEVAYGNIGGSNRLDFTCIGSAVNLSARLEALTGKLERPVVVSEDLAGLTDRKLDRFGPFELKGVERPRHVFAPSDGRLAHW
jgi:adenylate cyclase